MDLLHFMNSIGYCSAQWRDAFISQGSLISLKGSEKLLNIGDELKGLYLFNTGSGMSYRYKSNGAKVFEFYIAPGGIIGEISYINSENSTKAVSNSIICATSDSDVYILKKDTVDGILRENAQMAFDISKMVLNKTKVMAYQNKMAKCSTFEKVVSFLYNAYHAKSDATLNVTQSALANVIDAHPVTVAYELKSLERIGVLFRGHGKLHLLDIDKLKKYNDSI